MIKDLGRILICIWLIFTSSVATGMNSEDRIIITVTGMPLIDSDKGGEVVGDDGKTKVVVSSGLLKDIYIVINLDPLNNPQVIDPENIKEANQEDDENPHYNRIHNSIREFNAYDAHNNLINEVQATIAIPYQDDDNDGIIDNTMPPVDEKSLEIYILEDRKWVSIEKIGGKQLGVDTTNNIVFGIVPHLSVYILMEIPFGEIFGRVTETDGTPIKKVKVEAIREDTSRFTETKEDGSYRIEDLKMNREYTIKVTKEGYGAKVESVILREKRMEMNFTLIPYLFETYVYPNPFDFTQRYDVPYPRIKYTLPERCHVRIRIYNIAGELVKELVDEEKGPGTYRSEWRCDDQEGNEVASGVYLYVLERSNKKPIVKKIAIIR